MDGMIVSDVWGYWWHDCFWRLRMWMTWLFQVWRRVCGPGEGVWAQHPEHHGLHHLHVLAGLHLRCQLQGQRARFQGYQNQDTAWPKNSENKHRISSASMEGFNFGCAINFYALNWAHWGVDMLVHSLPLKSWNRLARCVWCFCHTSEPFVMMSPRRVLKFGFCGCVMSLIRILKLGFHWWCYWCSS